MRDFDIQREIIKKKMRGDTSEKNENAQNHIDLIMLFLSKAQKDIGFEYYAPITSSKKGVGKVVVAFKKALRKGIAFIIGPILDAQARKNYRFMRIMIEIATMLKDQAEYNMETEDRINDILLQLESSRQGKSRFEGTQK